MTKEKALAVSNKTDTIKAEFLNALLDPSICGNVVVACEKIGRSRSYIYQLREEDEDFAKRWDQYVKQGRMIGSGIAEWGLMANIRKGNIAAQIFYLKSNMSEVYGDKAQQANTTTTNNFYFGSLADFLAAMERRRAERSATEPAVIDGQPVPDNPGGAS